MKSELRPYTVVKTEKVKADKKLSFLYFWLKLAIKVAIKVLVSSLARVYIMYNRKNNHSSSTTVIISCESQSHFSTSELQCEIGIGGQPEKKETSILNNFFILRT